MKVKINKHEITYKFRNLKIGEAFSFNGHIYIKTDTVFKQEQCLNSVLLAIGYHHYFHDDDEVELVDAEVVVDF